MKRQNKYMFDRLSVLRKNQMIELSPLTFESIKGNAFTFSTSFYVLVIVRKLFLLLIF